MKTTCLYFLILFCLSGSFAYAQIVTLRDQEGGFPLERATLSSHDPLASATTNADGQADISDFKGAPVIEIRMLGYKTLILSYEEVVKNLPVLNLKPALVKMEEVVVSATRWNQSSREVPMRIAGISSVQTALQNPQTAADLLGVSGRVFIQKSQQGGGSPMIRGFATNRLLYSVDGVRMNTAIFRAGNIQNVISLDPLSIQSTEVLFGPGSVIYGSDAIGGVMNFQTLSPQYSLTGKPLVTGRAFSRYSSANNEKTVHFDVNAGGKGWAFLTSITSSDYSDLRMGSHGPEEYLRPFYVQRQDSTDVIVTNEDPRIQRPSAYSQLNMMQKLRVQPAHGLNLEYAFHYSETSPYARYDRHIRYRKGLPRYGEWNYGPQTWMMNSLSLRHTRTHSMYNELSLRIALQRFGESRIDRDIYKPVRHLRQEQVDAYSVNLDFQKVLSLKNTLIYGMEAVWNDVLSTGTDENIDEGTSVSGPSRYPDAEWASYAAYLTGRRKVSEQWILEAGARYNLFHLDARFDTTYYPFPFTEAQLNSGALTGSLGAVFQPGNHWVFRFNLATAFRSPNVDDMGKVFDSEPGAVTVPNPDLKAEFAYSGDFGIVKVIEEVLRLDLSVYYTYLDNALVRRDFTLNGADSILYEGEMSKVQAVQNAANAFVYGLEAGFELKLPAGFGLSSVVNYQHGEEELDEGSQSPSRHAPPWYGTSRLTWQAGKINLEINAMYSGAKSFEDLPEEEKAKTEIYAVDAEGNPWSPGWYTLNFKARCKIADNIVVSAGLENLTDRRYRPYSSGIVAPGRNFVLSFKATF